MLHTKRFPAFGTPAMFSSCFQVGYREMMRTGIADCSQVVLPHPALKRQDRLGKEPFAGFGTVVEDITESGYTKNQPILLGSF